MSDIKSVLTLLCQHLNLSVNVSFKPEYFRLAKFNDTAENVSKTFWTLLDILSLYAIKEKQIEFDFQEYGALSAIKLRFAYLQYPVIEFYALSENSNNNRQLLLAFAWLLGTQNVMDTIVRANLVNGALGRECSYKNTLENKELQDNTLGSVVAQINNILYLNGKVNYNIKEISELLSEKVKLVSKAHAASINVSGLTHLSVSELALIKRISTVNKTTYCTKDQKQLKELSTIGSLIDTHMKWMKKEHIFFEWMVTVVQEHNKFLGSNTININWQEVSKFISLLRHLIKDKLETLSSKDGDNYLDSRFGCVSRLLRTQDSNTEVGDWLTKAVVCLTQETDDFSKKKIELSRELKEVLQLIPSCIQV